MAGPAGGWLPLLSQAAPAGWLAPLGVRLGVGPASQGEGSEDPTLAESPPMPYPELLRLQRGQTLGERAWTLARQGFSPELFFVALTGPPSSQAYFRGEAGAIWLAPRISPDVQS